MSGTDTAADVPDRYDIVIDGYGYVTARAVDPNLPFRTQQVALSYTPTFVERQNVSGNYGDDSQAFFLTASQNNWALGEGQKFFRSTDTGSVEKYWDSQAVDISIPGEVSLLPGITSLTLGASPTALGTGKAGAWGGNGSLLIGDGTALKLLAANATLSSFGASGIWGAGTTDPYGPSGVCFDGDIWYATASSGSVVTKIRKYTGAWADFSATPADAITFHNNALYGVRLSLAAGAASYDLLTYSTAGVATTLFSWKTALGNARQVAPVNLFSVGGTLYILFQYLAGVDQGGQLWAYDGTNTLVKATFPQNFVARQACVANGSVFIAGIFQKKLGTTTYSRPALYNYTTDGSISVVWQSPTLSSATNAQGAGVAPWDNGVVFWDGASQTFKRYDEATGAISTLAPFNSVSSSNSGYLGSTAEFFSGTVQETSTLKLPFYPSSAIATSGYVSTSLFDFDSSLTKQFRGIKVDFTAATDGDGGSVDIAYRINDLNGSYTTLQTGAVSGTEYLLSGISGHSISIKITINKGTSTAGPVLKRVYVRGVPVLTTFRVNQYILDLGGDASDHNLVERRDNSDHNYTGEEMRVHLTAAIQSTTPITVTDRTGTYTAILEPGNCEFDQTRPGQWYAQIRLREV